MTHPLSVDYLALMTKAMTEARRLATEERRALDKRRRKYSKPKGKRAQDRRRG